MQHDGTRLEDFDIAVAEGRDLAERLPLTIAGGGLDLRIDQHCVIRKPCFLQGPAHAEVADIALRKARDPAEGGELHCHRLDLGLLQIVVMA